MALVWLAVVGLGVKVCIENFDGLRQQSQGVLEPGNLFLLYIGLIVIKTLHEFGHSFACKKHGGEVHVMGVMLLIFTPTPYMDATASWGFRNRWHRILVGAAGMIVEIFFAAIAAIIWAKTGPGTVHSLAYNMIFVASVSTIIFNANPLLRYDGYYMLSDWLEIPNLYQRSGQQLKYWMERFLFGVKKAVNPARGNREAVWLSVYAVLSGIYRIIVFGGILLFVADRFLILGILMALVCAISWVMVPVGRFIKYLATSPQLERNRVRAVAVSACVVLGIIGFLQFVPFPSHFRAPGILEAQEKTDEVNLVPGFVEALLTEPGSSVTNGQPLLKLGNREMELQRVAALARLEETQAMWRQAMQTNVANLKPIQQRLESVQKQLKRLDSEIGSLVVRAGQDGTWVSPEAKDFIGRWLPRGSNLGLVINPKSFYFTATVKQTEVNRLFSRQIHGATARLKGQAGERLELGELKVIPAAQRTLPSAALGWQAGGEMPVAMNDSKGRTASEPFFEVKAAVRASKAASLVHGRSGKMRFDLDPEPLLRQWLRKLYQMLQKRYQLT
jgi:putative peptide zinc metalloprotease protein